MVLLLIFWLDFMKEETVENDDLEARKIRILKQAVFGVSISNKDLSNKEDSKLKNYQAKLNKYLEEDGDKILEIKPILQNGEGRYSAGCIKVTEKKIMVCYHGTKFKDYYSEDPVLKEGARRQIEHNSHNSLVDMGLGPQIVKVKEGYKAEYIASRDSMSNLLSEALAPPNDKKPVEFNGHSLGGAVATLAALDFKCSNLEIDDSRISVNTFGAPKVLSEEAVRLYESKGLAKNTTRLVQYLDPATGYPSGEDYRHVGESITLVGVATLHSTNTYRKIAEKKLQPKHINPDLGAYRRLVEKMNKVMLAVSKFIGFGGAIENQKLDSKQPELIKGNSEHSRNYRQI